MIRRKFSGKRNDLFIDKILGNAYNKSEKTGEGANHERV